MSLTLGSITAITGQSVFLSYLLSLDIRFGSADLLELELDLRLVLLDLENRRLPDMLRDELLLPDRIRMKGRRVSAVVVCAGLFLVQRTIRFSWNKRNVYKLLKNLIDSNDRNMLKRMCILELHVCMYKVQLYILFHFESRVMGKSWPIEVDKDASIQ